MVTTSLYGRYGNECFQVANCIAYALRHKLNFVIPKYGVNFGQKTSYKFPNQSEEIPVIKRFVQRGHGYSEIPYYPEIHLHGHFQSEKYFKDKKKEVRELMGFPEATINKCAIHVRRSDFLMQPNSFPILPIDYYDAAVGTIIRKYDIKKYTIFSDDIEWCKKHFEDFDDFVETGDPEADLKYMASFKYQIIANSSYSLFASLINDKTVIAPDPSMWFGHKVKLDTKDLLPDHFIKIKTLQPA